MMEKKFDDWIPEHEKSVKKMHLLIRANRITHSQSRLTML